MDILSIIEKQQNKLLLVLTGFVIMILIGLLDLRTGYEMAFSIFYVLPISLITWVTSRQLGFIVSFLCTIIWLSVEIFSNRPYSHVFFPVWNFLMRLSVFFVITILLSKLKEIMNHEKQLARIDNLTGAINRRFYYYLTQMEIDRCQRDSHPLTIVYIDLDNFKTVNDQFGHHMGDQVLCTVVSSIKKNLRKTDVVARIGGDEFALLLPKTDYESAYIVLSKVQYSLLEAMRINNWSVTFSIGVLTCKTMSYTIETLLKMADDLMYSVKKNKKNDILYKTIP